MIERKHNRALVWFRRDLRDFDHAALFEALREARAVFCAFIFDREILDALPTPDDRRVEFIWDSVRELDAALRARGGGLIVRHAFARDAVPELAGALMRAPGHVRGPGVPGKRRSIARTSWRHRSAPAPS